MQLGSISSPYNPTNQGELITAQLCRPPSTKVCVNDFRSSRRRFHRRARRCPGRVRAGVFEFSALHKRKITLEPEN